MIFRLSGFWKSCASPWGWRAPPLTAAWRQKREKISLNFSTPRIQPFVWIIFVETTLKQVIYFLMGLNEFA